MHATSSHPIYNIRVNAAVPPRVVAYLPKEWLLKTQEAISGLIPPHRFATVDCIVAAVCILASAAAKMITGVTRPVNGPQTVQ